MKKFTLLVAFLICAVSFGQGVPSLDYPSKATQSDRVERGAATSDSPYSSFTEVPKDAVIGIARLAAVSASKATLVQNTDPRGPELLERLASLELQLGSIYDYFTAEELTVLNEYMASGHGITSTKMANFPADVNEHIQGASGPVGMVEYTATTYNGRSYQNVYSRSVAELAYESGPYFNVAGNPDISLLENVTLGMTTLGFGMQVAAGNRVADDIILTDDYEITELVFYGYQTNETAPTINEINVQIWDGDPGAGGSVIWGDATTNVLTSAEYANAIRHSEDNPGTARQLNKVTVAVSGLNLSAGTYWVDWQMGGTGASGPWQPPVAILGQNTTGNAQQSIGGVWAPLVDGGTGTAQGIPIQVYGNCTSCGGGGGGDVVYANNSGDGTFVSFDKTTPGTFTTIGPNSGTGFEGAGAVDPNNPAVAYVLGDDQLFSLDLASGVYTNLGALPNPNGLIWTGLSYDPTSGTLYGCATDITQSNLYTIDPGAVSATLVGAMGMPAAIDIAIDNNGQGYSYDIVTDEFFTFNVGTGAASVVGPLGFDANFGQGLAYNSVDGILYMNAFNNTVFSGEWREVNTANGSSSLIGAFPGGVQVPWASVDLSGGGGGGGCTTGVFADRGAFEAAFGGTLNEEGFISSISPNDICSDTNPINSSGNLCFAPGDILDGIEVAADLGPDTVHIPSGFFGNPVPMVGPNFFSDVLLLNFPNGDVDSFGVDVYLPLTGATDVVADVFGASGLLESITVTVPGGPDSAFIGYIGAEPITQVIIASIDGGAQGELIGSAAFGMCEGGGGGGGCGDFTYVNSSPTGNGVPSQIFADFPDFDCQAVDDIFFTGNDAGEICSLAVTGSYTAGGLPADPNNTVELVIFNDNGGVPGSVFYSETFPGSVDADGDGSFMLEPTGAPTLNGDTRYWIQVQANMEFGISGQWFWSSASDGNDDPALWQNPGGGFGLCPSWGTFADCGVGGGLGPDLLMDIELIDVEVITYDDCLGALPIGCGDVVQGETITATLDNVPDCDPNVPNAPGVWYVWEDTSGLASNISVSTCSANTDYDTQLTVYSGDCNNLVCVGNNDDDCGLQSTVAFTTDGSPTTYYILVQGWNGSTGNFELSMTCECIAPPNDDIANAIDLDELGCPFTDEAVAMPCATVENGTPANCDITGANGVWYVFTPEIDGEITATIASPGGAPGTNLSVNNGPLAGDYNPVAASFGGAIPISPLTQDAAVVIDNDTTGDPQDACDPIANGADLSGKIAVVRRGSCEFGFKALAAQNEGAVAVVVVNNQPGDPIVMGGGAVGDQVTIPVVMISDVEGEPIITELLGGNTVNMTLSSDFPTVSSVTFYTAPDESSTEDELVWVDWWQNQCLPSESATIPVVAGQTYYCFVVNSGSVTDIVFDNCQLGTNENQIEGFVYYPNPTNDRLNLSATQNIEKVAIYNILGQKVIDMDVESTQTQVSVAHLAAGAYIMEVMVDGQRGTYKVIKN